MARWPWALGRLADPLEGCWQLAELATTRGTPRLPESSFTSDTHTVERFGPIREGDREAAGQHKWLPAYTG